MIELIGRQRLTKRRQDRIHSASRRDRVTPGAFSHPVHELIEAEYFGLFFRREQGVLLRSGKEGRQVAGLATADGLRQGGQGGACQLPRLTFKQAGTLGYSRNDFVVVHCFSSSFGSDIVPNGQASVHRAGEPDFGVRYYPGRRTHITRPPYSSVREVDSSEDLWL